MSQNLILTGREIVCPTGGVSPVIIDLAALAKLEARIAEVAIVTPGKAPELLAAYNQAFLDINDLIAPLRANLIEAKTLASSTRSRIILDEVPRILKEKGLWSARMPAGSEDLRNAVLDGCQEYTEARDKCLQIECVIKFLEDKREAFVNAYTSVKKIMGEDTYPTRTSSATSGGGTSSPAPVGGTNLRSQCALCGEGQYETSSGTTCPNGHGGAPSKSPSAFWGGAR